MGYLKPPELVPVLGDQPGVCEICRGWSDDYPRCYNCSLAADYFPRGRIPVVAPLALAVKHSPLAGALWAYKDHPSADARADARDSLARFLDQMSLHEACLGLRANVRTFDTVCWVPSTHRARDAHPLRNLIAADDSLGSRLIDALSVKQSDNADRAFQADRFTASREVRGARCLVVDDTWTTGGSALGAALALLKAGAAAASVVVIGRHFVPAFRKSSIYSDHAIDIGFESKFCTFCDRRPAAVPDLPDRARRLR